MRVVRHLTPGSRPFRRPVVALGSFDGVHLGHRTIFERTRSLAAQRDSEAVAFTFWPHPIAVLAPDHAPRMITSLARRLAVLRSVGLDGVFVQRFTRRFAALAPEEFVRDWFVRGLGVAAVVVGYNVTFGHERRGTPARLAELGAEFGFDVEIVSPVEVGEIAASSSEVRRRIDAGDVAGANRLLGRPHSLLGLVRHGDHRGARIGFPTANLLPRGGLLPPDGVYAVRVGLDGEPPLRPGVANLGSNPTFGANARRLETHLFDFDGDIYGHRIEVALVERLRGETKFGSVEELVARIRADAAEARSRLGAAR